MRYGFILPGGTATQQLELAEIADRSGWDGVFVWEAAYGVDAWTLLGAMAQRTERVRLGTMLTPLPWRRPWKVASQVVTLDQLSNGRAILAVGLGAVDSELGNTGEETDRRVRAEMLDEGIDLIRGFWEGRLQFEGKRYQADLFGRNDLAEVAAPVQERIPIWVVAAWPRQKSMRRALRCDGLLPNVLRDGIPDQRTPEDMAVTPDDMRAIRDWLREQGASPDFDLIAEGETPADDPEDARRVVAPWADAGATWWLEARWAMPHHSPERLRQVRERLEAGPPR
jgi:alkanesulfonate monooxygenase SsuD/methylene tetrahydromethanopterin reductase-like flavin-dependent oxidoreductase (luciferase family)